MWLYFPNYANAQGGGGGNRYFDGISTKNVLSSIKKKVVMKIFFLLFIYSFTNE